MCQYRTEYSKYGMAVAGNNLTWLRLSEQETLRICKKMFRVRKPRSFYTV